MHHVARALHRGLHQVPRPVLHHQLERGRSVHDGAAPLERRLEAAGLQEVCLKQAQARDVGLQVLHLVGVGEGPARARAAMLAA